MELIEHRCKRCGGELKNVGEGRWSCPYCACVYDEAVVQRNTKTLHEEFDEVKREIVCNLRRNLYDTVNEEFISSEKVRECAVELKKYLPDDFAACFYEVAVGNNVKQLTRYIRKINVEENYSEIECVVRFLIKSLQTEYLLELNNLVERAYKQRDLVLFEKYSTEISVEAEKVENGVYETKLPREVFIAYSSKDMEVVSELCEALEGQGLKCFVAARNLRHGKGSVENYDRLLCEAMDHCKSFVFVSSTNSRSFSCDALIKELPYIQERDIENAPAEHKNNYASMPHSYKKPRVEYRIEESRGFSAPDAISNEFFDGYERVYSPEAVAERVALQLVSAAEKKAEKKSAPAPAPAPVVVQAAPAEVGGQRIEPLLKRAAIFIDDGEWEDAEAYCEKALDIDPECAQAYIYKLMIDLRVKKQEELANCKESFEDNGNFKKALRFGDEETFDALNGYVEAIKERNETERKDKIYSVACNLMKDHTATSYSAAISKFGQIYNWRDSKELIERCRNEIKIIEDSIEAARVEAENKKKDDIYRSALILLNSRDSNSKILIQNINAAKNKLAKISGWRDAEEKILECDRRLDEIKKQIEIEMLAVEKRRRKAIKISAICSGIIAIVIIFAIVLNTVIIPAIEENQSYNNAISLMGDGKYEEAIEAFEALDGYKDSTDRIEECHTKIKDNAYDAALKLMEEGEYDEAIKAFEALDGYKESTKKIDECKTAILDKKYNEAVSLVSSKKYAEAIKAFKALNGYKDSSDKIIECEMALKDIDYNAAVALMTEGKYAEAVVVFEALGDHRDSAAKIEECKTAIKDIDYDAAVALMTEGKYAEAIVAFEALGDHKDSTAKIEECNTALKDIDYDSAVALMTDGKYAEAIVAFEALGDHRDSAAKIEECKTAIKDIDYDAAVALMTEGKYAEAIVAFEALGDHRDSAAKIEECNTALKDIDYDSAVALMTEGKYAEAIVAFEAMNGYRDSADKIVECETAIKDIDYDAAVVLMSEGKYAEAITAFEAINGYRDSADKIVECETALKDIDYNAAIALMTEGKYAEAIVAFQAMNGYKDSAEKIAECETALKDIDYDVAVALMTEGKYREAIIAFQKLNGHRDSREKIDECNEILNSKAYSTEGVAYDISSDGTYAIVIGYAGTDTDVVIAEEYLGVPVKIIDEEVFYYKSIVSIHLPKTLTEIGWYAFYGCGNLSAVYIDDIEAWCGIEFSSSANPLYYADKLYVDNKLTQHIVIPDGVTAIKDNAFSNFSGIESISIPSSVTWIGWYAFYGCSNLSAVYIDDIEAWCGIEFSSSANPLYYADKLNVDNKLTQHIVIPDGVTAIKDNAFSNFSGIESISIPSSVTEIGWYAFYGCNNLQSVEYDGTTTDWFKITFDSGNDIVKNAHVIFK